MTYDTTAVGVSFLPECTYGDIRSVARTDFDGQRLFV